MTDYNGPQTLETRVQELEECVYLNADILGTYARTFQTLTERIYELEKMVAQQRADWLMSDAALAEEKKINLGRNL